MNALRVLAEPRTVWNDDQNAALLPVPEERYNHPSGYFLVLGWYKNRGRTEDAFLMGDAMEPTPLTLEVAEAILTHAKMIRRGQK